jgi:hypothetical protein
MQKSGYRVRSKVCLEGHIALHMIRESRAEGPQQITQAFLKARKGIHMTQHLYYNLHLL